MYQVYARVDSAGRLLELNSSAFLADPAGWVCIDEGEGDRFMHAQGNYLDGPLTDGRGVLRYKLEGGAIVERSGAETDADAAALQAPVVSDTELALVELAGIVAEQQAAIMELAGMIAERGIS